MHRDSGQIPLPGGWRGRVRSGMLHVISLAQFTLAYTRSWAVNCPVARVRLKAGNGLPLFVADVRCAALSTDLLINDQALRHRRPEKPLSRTVQPRKPALQTS